MPDEAVLLDDYSPCGQVCLYLVCKLRGVDIDFGRIESLLGSGDDNHQHSFAELSSAAEQLGLKPVGVRVGRQLVMALPTPSIVYTRNPVGEPRPHLSVLLRASSEGVTILDPPYPAREMPWSLFEHYWTGDTLICPRSDAEMTEIGGHLYGASEVRVWKWALVGEFGVAMACLAVLMMPSHRDRSATMIRHGISYVRSAGGLRQVLAGRRLWIWGVVVCGAVGTVVLVTSVKWRWPTSSPELVIDETFIDLGEYSPGQYEKTVLLRNAGREPLDISRVESSCSCAVVSRPDRIEPGSSREMKVKFGVGPGQGYANLTVLSNDPRGPHDLTIKWMGSAMPALVPRWIVDARVPLGTTFERTVSITYPGGRSALVPEVVRADPRNTAIRIMVVGNDPAAFRTASEVSEHSAVGYLNLRLRVDSPPEPGEVKTSALLTVKYGQHTYELKLPIVVTFVGATAVEPDRVVFASARRDALVGQTRTLKLIRREGAEKVTVKRCPPWLTCELANGESELRVRVTQSPTAPLHEERVELAVESRPGLTIPVSVAAFVQEME